jgi:4'-phosphopantetheinyl transferase
MSEEKLRHLRRTLTSEEQERADRFHFERDRRRYVGSHGVLRDILSRYVGVEPGQLRFQHGPHGKPALAEAPGGQELGFNLTHSHRLALCAVTRGREAGIDLEYMRSGFSEDRIAEQFFSPGEIEELRALPQEAKREAFFSCWTRKEAYLKAMGEGLLSPLDQFSVSLTPGEPAVLRSVAGDPSETVRWSLRALTPGPGYAAALVVEGRSWQLTCWQWLPRL